MWYLVFWIVVGLAAGLLSKSAPPGVRIGGMSGDLISGTAGAVFGGWLSSHMMGEGYIAWMGSMVGAVVGAFALLFLLRLSFSKA
ncbi:MAG: GlsB/YeaQ/YmgE family stress response membrane protein [Planctomycetes bacterium]|nr:GlsB/YeaQ/YmgE family stress response membrane protein [Planctomycetota bacterium]